MGKKKKGGGGGGGGGGEGGGGGGGSGGGDGSKREGGGSVQTGVGQCSNTSPSSTAPDETDQAPCETANTDHGNSGLRTVSGDEVKASKVGKGGGKDGGVFLTGVLKVDFHCDGCEDKIRGSIRGFKGVEGVKMDRGANRVTVVGTMDPWKLRDRIQKKTKKMVEVLSPAQKKQGGGDKQSASGNNNCNKKEKQCDDSKEAENSCNLKEEGKKCDNKQALVVVNTMVLKVMLHCDGCILRIRGVLMKIKGVEQVAIDTQKNQITVKGTMKTKGFVEFLARKIHRHVELVGQKEQKEKENLEKEKEKEEKKEKEKSCAGKMTCQAHMGWCHCDKCEYHVYMVPAPQLFSDENPNACAVI